jgi:hypothetical protein
VFTHYDTPAWVLLEEHFVMVEAGNVGQASRLSPTSELPNFRLEAHFLSAVLVVPSGCWGQARRLSYNFANSSRIIFASG